MVFYFVQKGETLYVIAKRYRTTVHALVAANRLEDPNAIYPGQALIIPRPGEVPSPPPGGIVHLVRRGETVFELAARFQTTAQEILRANQIVHPEFVLPGQRLVIPEPSEPEEEWPMLGRTPSRSGVSPVALEGKPIADWVYRPQHERGVPPSAAVIRYGRLYAGLGDGNYYSLDLKTGLVKWRLTFEGEGPAEYPLAAPVIYDGLAYVCSPHGSVAGVDAYTGRQIWRYETNAPITASPVAEDGMLHVATESGELYALEVKTGTVVWKSQVGSAINRPAAMGDDKLFVVTANGRLVALEAESGRVCWETDGAVAESPVFATVSVLVGNRAYSPETGALCWQAETTGAVLATLLNHVYYREGVVDLFTGLFTGTQPSTSEQNASEAGSEAGGLTQTTACILAGPLLLGLSEGHLHAWRADDVTLSWAIDLAKPGTQPPAVASERLALTLADGSVQTYRFEPEASTD